MKNGGIIGTMYEVVGKISGLPDLRCIDDQQGINRKITACLMKMCCVSYSTKFNLNVQNDGHGCLSYNVDSWYNTGIDIGFTNGVVSNVQEFN